MDKKLFVYMNGLFVGTWEQAPSLVQSFTYDPAWLHNPKGRAICRGMVNPANKLAD